MNLVPSRLADGVARLLPGWEHVPHEHVARGAFLVTPEDTQDQSLELVVGVLQPLRAQENVPDRLVERAFFQALPKGFFNQGR